MLCRNFCESVSHGRTETFPRTSVLDVLMRLSLDITTHPRWDFCGQSRRPRRSQSRHNRFHTPRHRKVESALINFRSDGFRNSLRTHNLCHKRARLSLMMTHWNVRAKVLYRHWSRIAFRWVIVLSFLALEQIIFVCFEQMVSLWWSKLYFCGRANDIFVLSANETSSRCRLWNRWLPNPAH